MPDNAAARSAAPGPDTKSARPVNPDRVGEELADDANIWHVYDRVSKEDDERRTKAWDTGLNNLALFAGLFSAVTTAFIIEARKDMEPDYAQLAFLVLNATAFGEKPVHQPFVVPSGARTVHCLWVSSLILSLSTALIAIMGKDWISMYTARPVCNLRQWAEMRTYRLLCVERWYMSGVIATAPVLLHVSLILFGAGLVLFISSDPFTHHLTLGLSLAAGALYLAITLSAMLFSDSPFKSPATQMFRAAFSAFFSYVYSATIRPKRNLVGTVLRDFNMMAVGRADDSAFVRASIADAHPRLPLTGPALFLSRLRDLVYPAERNEVHGLIPDVSVVVVGRAAEAVILPDYTPESRRRHSLQSIVMAGMESASDISLVASVQSLPASLRSARQSLRWAQVRSHLRSLVSSICRIPLGDWFLSSTWTDLPTHRRPQLLAEALSWLNGASQAPDICSAIVFALGDLDVGPQVAHHLSPALHTRLTDEIRRTWQQVNFLMLSRYVLAEQNNPGPSVLGFDQFKECFNRYRDLALHCEDGLAAVSMIAPSNILPPNVAPYFPVQVSQPRMPSFLLPRVQTTERIAAVSSEILILLSNRYRTHLRTTSSFNLKNLESHLYRSLEFWERKAYATAVTVNYGGTAGAIELLTFLCCHGRISGIAKANAVELIMELLVHPPVREHRCLAYLFGSHELWAATWNDKHWSSKSLNFLSKSLAISCCHPFEPTSVRTLSDDRQFDLALARTVDMMCSQNYRLFGWEEPWIEYLFGLLCLSPSPSFSDDTEKTDVIRIILESSALLGAVDMLSYVSYGDDVVRSAIAILAAIIGHLERRLRDAATICSGGRLLAALARTVVKGRHGEVTWDLGKWLRTEALAILQNCPSSTMPMQDVHDALTALYPLCEHNNELRTHWDCIDYPGRPGDIFSSPFLDIGAFFDNVEHPLTRDSDESSDDEE